MKKYLILILSIMIVFLPNTVLAKKKTTTTKAKDPVNVYIFYSETCPHCALLHEYTDELQKDKKMSKKFKVVDYEVSNEENADLLLKVGTYFDEDVSGVPFYVIGKQTFSGFGEDSGSTLEDAINTEYSNKDYEDVVAKIIDGTIQVDTTQNSNESSSSSDTATYIILGIIIVAVVAIAFGRSKKDEEN